MQQLGVTYKFLGGGHSLFLSNLLLHSCLSIPTVIAVTVVEAEMFVVGAGVVQPDLMSLPPLTVPSDGH